MVDSWEDGLPKAIVALVIVFVFAALGQVLVGMVGRRLQGAVTWGPLVKLNNVGGAGLSVFTMLLVVWFLAGVYATGNSSSLARDVRQSQVIGAFDALMPFESFILSGQIESMYDETGFPTVFAGLGPEPIQSIGAPELGDPAQRGCGPGCRADGEDPWRGAVVQRWARGFGFRVRARTRPHQRARARRSARACRWSPRTAARSTVTSSTSTPTWTSR